jgi:hypothetical protein
MQSELDYLLTHKASEQSLHETRMREYDIRIAEIVPDYEEKPEIVECPVSNSGDPVQFCDSNMNPLGDLSDAIDCSDFIGFKYEDEFVDINPRLYVLRDCDGKKCETSMLDSEVGDYEVLTPTHVLFKGAKQ